MLAFFLVHSAAQHCLPNGITFTTQNQINQFPVNYPGCQIIDGFVTINDQVDNNIKNLEGLYPLTAIGGTLNIVQNNALTRLTGLDSLLETGDLFIQFNPALTDLNALGKLKKIHQAATIQFNETLPTLEGLDQLESIGTYLSIKNNNSLEAIRGLRQLKKVGQWMAIQFNPALKKIDGLDSLSIVSDWMSIQFNDILDTIAGLNELDTVGNFFSIQDNDKLSSISGLNGLKKVNGFLTIQRNNELLHISGFRGLDTIALFCAIQNNAKLDGITGFTSLRHIEGNLTFNTNPMLTALDSFYQLRTIKGTLNVLNNPSLHSIEGLEQLDPLSIQNLLIRDCDNLSVCDIASLCAYLEDPENPATIDNNNNGCNTRDEITDRCALHPACTMLVSPPDGSIDVWINSALSWMEVADASGYVLNIGTSAGNHDLLHKMDVGNQTAYDPPDFPCAREIFVDIIPYNAFGNAFGCLSESFHTEAILAIAGDDRIICQGESVPLNAEGGTFFEWMPAESLDDPFSQNPQAYPAETTHYIVRVSNGTACYDTDTTMVQVLEAPVPHAQATDESGNGFHDGTATCLPEGGSPPYQFEWSDGSQTQSISGLSPGVYLLTITDSNQCSGTDSVQVGAYVCPEQVMLFQSEDASCKGSCNGFIELIDVMGGLPPYTYAWDDNSQENHIEELCTGNYSVTVTDASNCSIDSVFYIGEPDSLMTGITSTDETGHDFVDGTATAIPSGGTPPFSFYWSTGDTVSGITGLSPGVYYLTLTDDHDCITEDSVTIRKYYCPGITLQARVDAATCFGHCDGMIVCAPAGGTAPYVFEWSHSGTGASITGLCAGTYQLTLTDSKHCSITDSFLISQPDQIVLTVDSIRDERTGQGGFIELSLSGGINFICQWSGPGDFFSENEDIYELEAGCYTLIATHPETGCSVDTTICVADLTGVFEENDLSSAIRIYPNPSDGPFTLDISAREDIKFSVRMLDQLGRAAPFVFHEKVGKSYQYELLAEANGIYFLEIKTDKGALYRKILYTGGK